MKRDKEGFIRRLQGRVKTHSDGCITYRGTKHKSGYPRLNFRYKGKHMSITAARVFLILMLARPIQLAHDAGHGCNRRTCVRHLFEQHYSENCITV